MPKGKVLIVTAYHGVSNVKMIATQQNEDFRQLISVGDNGTLQCEPNGSPRYDEEHKYPDIITIIIDWSNFPKNFPENTANDIGSKLEKLHPGVLMAQVNK